MMKRKSSLAVLSAAAALGFAWSAQAETLRVLTMSDTSYSDKDVLGMAKEYETANPGTTVLVDFVPYAGLRDRIILSQGSDEAYDVVLSDVVWPAEFAQKGILLDVTDRVSDDLKPKVFAGGWNSAAYDGRLYGFPWMVDSKLLYVNTEKLAAIGAQPPQTWDDLIAQAREMKAKGVLDYPIVMNWGQNEEITGDFAVFLHSFGGEFPTTADANFREPGRQALAWMKSLLTDGLVNPSSLEYNAEDGRRAFLSGQAAYSLNWQYVYGLSKNPEESQVVGKVAVVPWPKGQNSVLGASLNGSMALGITTKSKNPDLAWSFISFMTSEDLQERYARAVLPVWKDSFAKPDVVAGQEDLVAAADVTFENMIVRPTVVNYAEVTLAVQEAVQAYLFDQIDADAALDAIAAKFVK
jgi:multiple sugar transport system substrate-binding protein